MARKRTAPEKDVIGRLSDAGEEALQRLGDLPGGKIVLDAATNFRDRLDEITKKLRTIDPLERRVSALEKRLDSLEKPAKPATRAKKSTARKTSTASKSKTPSASASTRETP